MRNRSQYSRLSLFLWYLLSSNGTICSLCDDLSPLVIHSAQAHTTASNARVPNSNSGKEKHPKPATLSFPCHPFAHASRPIIKHSFLRFWVCFRSKPYKPQISLSMAYSMHQTRELAKSCRGEPKAQCRKRASQGHTHGCRGPIPEPRP